jgi:hypothetical protein
MSKLKLLIALACLFILPTISFAWNIPGHMVTAAIAYRELKAKDPKALSKIISILKKHPQYGQLFAPKLQAENLSQEEKDLYLFMLASRWPDDIKGTTYEPKHHNWHYINYPYVHPGSEVAVPPADTVDIITAYKHNLGILKSKSGDEEKAIALCWVIHLMGDVHQPLHTAALFSPQLPEGDQGGNKLFIKAEEGGKSFTLHSFWDWLVIGSQNFREADNRAVLLKNQPKLGRKKLKELKDKKFESWAEKESFELAKVYVYSQDNLQTSTVKEQPVLLSKQYIDSAKAVAEKRVVLAGYRMADQLCKVF